MATYRSCFSIPVESILLLLGSSNKGIVVQCSPISSVAPHQVRRSLISSVHLIKCTIHQSALVPSSSVPFTNLHCVPSTSALFTNLHVAPSTSAPYNQSTVLYLQMLHQSPLLHFYSCTIYSVAPFVSYYFMSCDYDTRQFYIINNLSTDVNMPCRLFNCIIQI